MHGNKAARSPIRKESTMKSICCLVCALMISLGGNASAQAARGPEETLDGFRELHWGETAAVAKAKMQKVEGTSFDAAATGQFTDGTQCYAGGTFAGEAVERYELRFFKDALCGVNVVFSKWGSENIVSVYEKIRDFLSARYGKPVNDFSKFSEPFRKGDGREDVAFAAGKGIMTCLWTFPVPGEMSNSIFMDVNQRLQIVIRLENGKLLKESQPRRK